MIHESRSKDEEEESDSLKFKEMFILAIATSIDALAVGITFACMPVQILATTNCIVNTAVGCGIIAVITGILSMIGVKVGSIFGTKYKNKAELAGGVVLVLIGLKILLEHFGVL